MAALLITYDLHRPGQDYEALHEAIKGLGLWWHYLESTWLVIATLTPSKAWDAISGACDANDNVLIVDVTGRSRSGWLPKDAWAWLDQNV